MLGCSKLNLICLNSLNLHLSAKWLTVGACLGMELENIPNISQAC